VYQAALVTGLSFAASGTLGGASLTISGTGFADFTSGFSDPIGSTAVRVAGSPCAPIAVSLNQIVCTLGAYSQSLLQPLQSTPINVNDTVLYSGGLGSYVRVWPRSQSGANQMMANAALPNFGTPQTVLRQAAGIQGQGYQTGLTSYMEITSGYITVSPHERC
jgi:hypothetical protein